LRARYIVDARICQKLLPSLDLMHAAFQIYQTPCHTSERLSIVNISCVEDERNPHPASQIILRRRGNRAAKKQNILSPKGES
jgi:hypothetical protein